jgi:2-dehydro-3-deoxyphosphogluconate aldolase / (4S)-4-hydroxy-2-oxoglutarate aldolase
MDREEVKSQINKIGIFPGIRTQSAKEALYAAKTLYAAGIPIAEVTMTVPNGVEVIREVAREFPNMAIGAGTVLDVETTKRCLDAGARFITSTGLVLDVLEVTLRVGIVAIPGALTPTEVISCWKAGADFIKIFPAAAVGGDLYIRSLKLPLPEISVIAAGGVDQKNAANFIRAGSSAIGLGAELLPHEAILKQQDDRIHELARRFLALVAEGRTRP